MHSLQRWSNDYRECRYWSSGRCAGSHLGAAVASTGIGSAEWNAGLVKLSLACTDVGAETAIQMFTGG